MRACLVWKVETDILFWPEKRERPVITGTIVAAAACDPQNVRERPRKGVKGGPPLPHQKEGPGGRDPKQRNYYLIHLIERLASRDWLGKKIITSQLSGLYETQLRGFLRTWTRTSSGDPGAGWWSYSHRAVRGMDVRMDSMRAPGVARPNLVPRSYTRLNST